MKELVKYVAYDEGTIEIRLIEYPTAKDWFEVKRRALKTIGMKPLNKPDSEWIASILEARHSPIRRAMYSFELDFIPSNTATHFARHKHADVYISSLRNDIQEYIDGDHAPRNTPVGMIIDANAEELQVIANKRLCKKAAELTRRVTKAMCQLAIAVTPEMKKCLVPLCVYCGNTCHEMKPCEKGVRLRNAHHTDRRTRRSNDRHEKKRFIPRRNRRKGRTV